MSELIVIGCDHAGYDLKREVLKELESMPITFSDLGCHSRETSVHYPVYAQKVIEALLAQTNSRGILICGTGLGMSIMANRYSGIRATLCHDSFSAKMSRMHNDANLLVMGGRVIGPGLAREIVRLWLTTPFEGGRHQERLDMIETLCRSGASGSEGGV